MVSRLFIAGACALGIGGALAGAALAEDPDMSGWSDASKLAPTSVQVWGPGGLERTIDCPTLTADPVCDPTPWPTNYDPLIAARDRAFRALSRAGRWFSAGGWDPAFAAIDAADASGGPGAAKAETDIMQVTLVGRDVALVGTAAGGEAKRKAVVRAAKKQRAAKRKRGRGANGAAKAGPKRP
ncbi:hypothetical protein [Conexibacter woesei]|uniref:Uncharacterized protein n=1 Tax=Conexibacter woesei (strain DSM 14684 / CCUG 47730 / CIP 108061 / JCM 11494 / NBRC 100937 / ID131577) TaxID=469383 RepID=D3FC01_CONWI|nr:hypothetical protein [Conexibacter woesei]ADB51416.1 hypothetical protein Cwoe_2997 [Conexibacter woesei DSM 14684]